MNRQTIVIKVGSSTVTDATGGVDRAYLTDLTDQIAELRGLGHAVVLVTSGAIAAGVEALGLPGRPTDMPTLQATAAIGQVRLVETYAVLAVMRGLPVEKFAPLAQSGPAICVICQSPSCAEERVPR